ncbi:MAG TPA: S24 family peptidase [Sphingobacteriaceae bacterium]
MLRKIETMNAPDLEPLEDPGKASGFQSPADDYKQDRLNIIGRLIHDPTNTYYFEADSDAMHLFGIKKGTLLVVDRSVIPAGGMLVIAWQEGSWMVRQLITHLRKRFLTTGEEDDVPIEICGESGVMIWGVVTWSCCPQMEMKKYVRAGRLQ